MPPKQSEICDCGALENASKEPDHPIRWNEQMNEYYIAHGKDGRMIVYYCPFCGGSTPKSRRGSFFAHVTRHEEHRIRELLRGLRTVSDVVAHFGRPDDEREGASRVRSPVGDAEPERGELFRSLVYRNLSPVADIVFYVGDGDTVRGTWVQKHVGEIHAG